MTSDFKSFSSKKKGWFAIVSIFSYGFNYLGIVN